ncbi:NAD(P)-dependent alcohol dehydrogenase [Geodermatophilus ruber]|uniref:NADPH:quinone reductase n=1 Tax=Geodermatophilus ruber TaxID=504800 RepID=A0A1I4AG77_9ACTN|nr:NAD(P)-dependent alcohol dehydrogenase [Geodermatophilus ruber]SFK54739.1 NADPH:quinone reductase [Geodermatophilus ruber]
MKAIVQDRYGTADALELRDVDVPEPRKGEVLVRVRAAGVDPGVWHLSTGLPYAVRLGAGLRRPRRRIPGMDLAGVVEAVGPGGARFRPGDEVFGTGSGSFAEYAVASAATLARKPTILSFEEAATVPVSGQTALEAVRRVGRVRPGQRVLVVGAGGGVGSFAVQLAAAAGASVTGVCSTGKLELVRSLGAVDVVDYTREGIADRGRIFDVVVDTAGNRSLAELRGVLVPRGTLVLVGGEGSDGKWLQGFDRQLRALLLSPFAGARLVPLLSRSSTAGLEALTELIEAGRVRPVVDRRYPLAAAADAVDHVGSGHARGKAVVVP